MDWSKRLSGVSTLNDFIELTQELESNPINPESIVVNMSTVMSLKKIRYLEVEFFNKCDGDGAAFKLFDIMLASPPLKSWSLLGPELIGLLQYWLDAVRKHLISHHIHWWSFLRKLLGFIKEIHRKDQSLSDVLVEHTAESLLDLCTSGKPDVNQRYEILHIFNLVSANSSRDIRAAMGSRFEPYFVRVAALVAGCGHAALQLGGCEALLRWLLQRRAAGPRRAAAARWLPPHLYPRTAHQLFLHRDWTNFYKDARDFINCLNETKDLVTSVRCKQLSVGEMMIVFGTEPRDTYLDVNIGSGSVTWILEPCLLELLGQRGATSCEALTVASHAASKVTLERMNSMAVVHVSLLSAAAVLPGRACSAALAAATSITAVLSASAAVRRLDAALRTVFHDKYEVLLDIDADINSPRSTSIADRNADDLPFVNEKNKRRQGYVRRPRRLATFSSPSTTSTTSLAQLHDKLASIPTGVFTKETLSVLAKPNLTAVSERTEYTQSEFDNSFASASTFKLRRSSVCNIRANLQNSTSKSDSEAHKSTSYIDEPKDDKTKAQSDNENTTWAHVANSCLFTATVGSLDENSINEIIERLPRDRSPNIDNLVDLLAQEALQARPEETDKYLDSGINSGEPKKTETQNSEIIEDTQFTGLKNVTKRPIKIVSKSTSDESNTEALNEVPNYVTFRKRNQRAKHLKTTERRNSKTVEEEVADFFSQNVSEHPRAENIISPSLARKINETSSDSSDDDCLLADIKKDKYNTINNDKFNMKKDEQHDIEIVKCLNSIVDKVCMGLDKCTEMMKKDGMETEIRNVMGDNRNKDMPLKDVSNTVEVIEEKEKTPKSTRGSAKTAITLKFAKKRKAPVKKPKSKLKIEPVSKMSTIPEANHESDANKTSNGSKKDSTDNETPIVGRKRRKLYSPKYDEINQENEDTMNVIYPTEPVTPKNNYSAVQNVEKIFTHESKMKIPKSVATSYKDIEKDREMFKKSRARKAKNKESPPSPKTRKLDDMFENLRTNIESNEKITLVDKKSDKDLAIFNFTSDSEDDAFQEKKIQVIQKKTSSSTLGRGRRAASKTSYAEDSRSSNNESSAKPPSKRKRMTKRKSTKNTKEHVNTNEIANKKVTINTKETTKIKEKETKETIIKERVIIIDQPILVDEKMRDLPPAQELNTSFVAAKVSKAIEDPEPMIQAPQLEEFQENGALRGTPSAKNSQKEQNADEHDYDIYKCLQSLRETESQNASQSSKSPAVSLKRLTPDDLAKWLPSNKSEEIPKRQGLEEDKTRSNPFENSSRNGEIAKSPTVALEKLTPEDLAQWLESAKSPEHKKFEKQIVKVPLEKRIETVTKVNTKPAAKEKRKRVTAKKKDKQIKPLQIIRDEESSSPLPGLVIEPESRKVYDDESLNTNFVNKMQKAYKEGPDIYDTTTTQNLLLDQDMPTSPQMNITEEISRMMQDEVWKLKETAQKSSDMDVNVINDTINSENGIKANKAESVKSSKSQRDKLKLKEKKTTTKEAKQVNRKDKRTREQMDDMNNTKGSQKSKVIKSSIEEIFDLDIEMPTRVQTRSKSRELQIVDNNEKMTTPRRKSHYKECITLTDVDISDANSERSIATNGINGHGDTDESPPSKKLLTEKFAPREIQDMDESMKKYYLELNAKANVSQDSIERRVLTCKSNRNQEYHSLSDASTAKKPQRMKLDEREYDIYKCLPSLRETDSQNSSQSSKSPAVSLKRLTPDDLAKWLPSNKSEKIPKRQGLEEDKKSSNPFEKTPVRTSARLNKKSQISPIELGTFLNTRDTSESRELTLNSCESQTKINQHFMRPTHQSSPISTSKSDDLLKKRSTIVSKSTKTSVQKKKLDFDGVASGSQQSSNVEEWLDNVSASCKDGAAVEVLQTMLEKINTTLTEMNENTTKLLIGLSVKAQTQLEDLKSKRHKLYEKVLADVTQLLHRRFAELDESVERDNTSFMSCWKSDASELVRQDCRQKRAMVALLREDLRAAMARLENTTGSPDKR